MKPNEEGMTLVIESLRSYFQAVKSFQIGSEVDIPTNSLGELDYQIDSKEDLTKKSKVNPKHNSKSFNSLIESINKTKLTNGVIPYTRVTNLIFEEPRALYDTLGDTLDSDWDNYYSTNSDSEIPEETVRIFLKIKEHIKLSIIHRNDVDDRLQEQLDNTLYKLDETKGELKELNLEIIKVDEEAHKKADKLVVQFITILGIFAAIMMGTMGSFQSFASIFSNAENIPIGKILLISAAGASGVTLILFLLLHAISKLTSFTLSNCNCKNIRKGSLQTIRDSLTVGLFGGDSTPKCNCSMFSKYPTIFIINYFFYYIGFTGFIFMYFNFNDYFNEGFWLHIRIIFSLYFVATFILLFIHRYLIDKVSDEKILRKFIEDVKKVPDYIFK